MTNGKGRGSSKKAASAGEFRYSDDVGSALIDGLTFYNKLVQYIEIDGDAIFEGDINLGPVERVQQQTDDRRAALASGQVAAGVVIAGSQFRWPNCVIPYQIADDLPNEGRVHDAIAHWTENTNYRFVVRTPANEAQFPDWVEFVPGNGCSSFVGRRGGRQPVTLASGCSTGNVIHEIGHVVGLWHEQSREDRDQFVTINFQNIIPSAVSNFNQRITDGEDVGPYDYGSIMHYPRKAFSINGQDTIVPTDPNAQIGQRNGLSQGDINAANSICVPRPPGTVPPQTFTRPTFTRPTFTVTRPTFTRPTFTVTRPTFTRPTFTRPTFTVTRPTFTRPTFTVTRPTFTRPTITRPTFTRPTFTRPTFTRPTITRPTFTRPTFTRPTFTRPTITRPTFTRPTFTRPTFTRPTITRPTFTRPTFTRPTFTRPTFTRPTFTRPTITRPTFTRPTFTRPTITRPTITRPTFTITRPTITRPTITGLPFRRLPRILGFDAGDYDDYGAYDDGSGYGYDDYGAYDDGSGYGYDDYGAYDDGSGYGYGYDDGTGGYGYDDGSGGGFGYDDGTGGGYGTVGASGLDPFGAIPSDSSGDSSSDAG